MLGAGSPGRTFCQPPPTNFATQMRQCSRSASTVFFFAHGPSDLRITVLRKSQCGELGFILRFIGPVLHGLFCGAKPSVCSTISWMFVLKNRKGKEDAAGDRG